MKNPSLNKIMADMKNKPSGKKSPKDIIVDPMGQWAHPGQNTRIPSNYITMQGVGYPVLAQASNGQTVMMYPGQNYVFPGAQYVDEYPDMQKMAGIYQPGGIIPGGYTVGVPMPQIPAMPTAVVPTNQATLKEYNGYSVVDFLKTQGKASDYNSRKAMAEAFGIKDYRGTAKQNKDLIDLISRNPSVLVNQSAPAPKKANPVVAPVGRTQSGVARAILMNRQHQEEQPTPTSLPNKLSSRQKRAVLMNQRLENQPEENIDPASTREAALRFRQARKAALEKQRIEAEERFYKGFHKTGGSTYNGGVWFQPGGMYMGGGDPINFMKDPNALYNFGGYFPQGPRFDVGGFIPYPTGNTFPDIAEMKSGGIHIKPSKRGTFTAAAKKHGKSVQAFASQVLANKQNYSPAMVKKANFARNASKWHHQDGGIAEGQVIDVTPDMLEQLRAGGYSFEIVND